MTHTKTTVEKTWMIYLIYKWKFFFTALLKNETGCLSKQWTFMMQGDICMGREAVKSKSFTRWLGSCREAVLYRAGRNNITTSKSQRKWKMNCQDKRYTHTHTHIYQVMEVASVLGQHRQEKAMTVFKDSYIYMYTVWNRTRVHRSSQVFPTVPRVHGDW